MTHRIGDPEGFCYGNMTTVKKGVGSRRFFMLAPGTPAGIRRFALAVISIPAFPACKASRPLLPGNKTQAGFIRSEFFNVDPCEIK